MDEFDKATIIHARMFRNMSRTLQVAHMQSVLTEYSRSWFPGSHIAIGVIEYDNMPEDLRECLEHCDYGIDLEPKWNWEKYFYFVIQRDK